MTSSADWGALGRELAAALHLDTQPLGISFTAAPPDGVPAYAEPMPAPTDDGRTGRVPAGCVFWMKAAETPYTTVEADHANCSVGSYTHGFLSLEEAAQHSDVAALLDSGWVTMEMVPHIPQVAEKPGAVTYGPLGSVPIDPDVVLLRLNPKQAMVLNDAVPSMRIEGKPQCHIVAIAKEQQQVAASVGCMLSRVRTGMPSEQMTCAIPGPQLASVVDAVKRTAEVDAVVARYAAADGRRFDV